MREVQIFHPNGTPNKRFRPRKGWEDWAPDYDWQAFGIPDNAYPEADQNGVRILNLGGKQKTPKDRAARWLLYAMLALAALGLAAAVVSFNAQFHFILQYKGDRKIAAIQAAIPDVGSMVFAALGIALALHGKRALRPRFLNLLCVGISVSMNYMGSFAGYKAHAVWVMASVVYAVASDTLIGVIRAHELARQKRLNEKLADEGTTPLDVLAGILLWTLRLILDPWGTVTGFRGWVLREVKVAPGTRAVIPAKQTPTPNKKTRVLPPPPNSPKGKGSRGPRSGSKTALFLARVEKKYRPLAEIDFSQVSPIALELHGDLDRAAAHTALSNHIKVAKAKAQSGGQA